MDSRVCMNPCCGTTSTSRWMDGWPLRAGDFANLCEACGDAYKKSIFCNTFHENESGWRNCKSCSKRLHCGCIASKFMLELLDGGGVECTNCMKNSSHSPAHCAGQLATSPLSHTAQHLPSRCSSDERRNGRSISQLNDAGEIVSSSLTAKIGSISMKEGYVWQSSRDAQEQSDGLGVSAENIKREQGASVSEARSACFPDMSKIGYSRSLNQNADEHSIIDRETYGSLTSAYLNISLGTSNPGSSVGLNNVPNNTKLASSREQKLQNRIPLLQGQRSRHPLLKPASTSPSTGSQSSKDVAPQIRVARPPGEGRGRNQLLPRYWPRITDQELQQIFGNSNSKIVPLFEKVLSASDAGRIGRLVLPKACAEAYFPPISQPEGLPLTIQDDKGKNWLFQFRFWPNNNSRMYVLEGVTPCIQSMQLQAGDTVTFSRIDPEGKLVMGFRKSTTSSSIPESQVGTTGNGRITSNAYISTTVENGYSGPFHSLKGNSDGCLNNLSEHLNISDADISWRRAEKNGGRSKEEIQSQQFQVQKKKRARNIGCKSKRLIIDKHDAMQLKITWEEAQDLFRPPPSVKPSIIMIEDHEFEEYEEPPVFGKMTLFTSRSSGEHDQWAQCDNCSKWRRVPMDALIPSRWTCADNSWDPKRSSCSALDEVTPNLIEDTKRSFEELHRLKLNRDVKKRRSIGSPKPIPQDMSALDALATVAVLGENGDTTTSTATTTKHPRHRPGCSCIVCIQPPSGKGPKHMPTCTCNVCMTVRRRFKTLMLRRKKRQSEQEAETARKKNSSTKEDGDIEKTPKCSIQIDASANETRQAHTSNSSVHKSVTEAEEVCNTLKVVPMENETKGQIDLNCDPVREDDLLAGACTPGISMMTLLQDAALPLETYLKQNGLTSLVGDQQTSSSVPFPGKESETKPDDGQFAPLQEQMAASAEGAHLSVDQMKNDAM